MKKLSILLPLLLTTNAYASDFYFKPYVGANYDYAKLDYQDIPGTGLNGSDIASDSLNGADVHIGARVHKYLGFEASYLWTADSTKDNVLNTGVNTKVNVRGETLDAMGYLPIDEKGKFELIGTVGVSHLRAHANFSALGANGSDSETETKGRFGGGAQYWLSDNINARGIVRYQGADFDGDLNNAIIASIGLNYQF